MSGTPAIRLIALGGALLVGAAALVAMNGGGTKESAPVVGEEARHAHRTKSSRIKVGTLSALEREIRGMSLRGLRDAIPENVDYQLISSSRNIDERTKLLFRRFGELAGEEALDEIVSRYGCSNFTSYAMAFALQGWARSDREAALEALYAMHRPPANKEDLLFAHGLSWKGTATTNGFG